MLIIRSICSVWLDTKRGHNFHPIRSERPIPQRSRQEIHAGVAVTSDDNRETFILTLVRPGRLDWTNPSNLLTSSILSLCVSPFCFHSLQSAWSHSAWRPLTSSTPPLFSAISLVRLSSVPLLQLRSKWNQTKSKLDYLNLQHAHDNPQDLFQPLRLAIYMTL